MTEQQRRRGGPVELALTQEAFRMAQQQRVAVIEPHAAAMTAIARFIRVIGPTEFLPPQVVVVRSATACRGTQPGDHRLPRNLRPRAKEVHYRFPASLGETGVPEHTRGHLVELAHSVGAVALTEVEVPAWNATPAVFAKAFARGLLQGQRPLDLLPEGVQPEVPDPPRVQRSAAMPVAVELRAIDAVGNSPRMPNPFYIDTLQP